MSKKIIFFLSFVLICILLVFALLSKKGQQISQDNFFYHQPTEEPQFQKTTGSTQLSDEKQKLAVFKKLDQIQSRLPVENNDLKLEYLPDSNKYILTKKNPTITDEDINQWLSQNQLSFLATTDLLFIKDAGSDTSKPFKSPVIISPTPYFDFAYDSSIDDSVSIIQNSLMNFVQAIKSMNSSPSISPTPNPTQSLSPTTTQVSPTSTSSNGNFDSLGLPTPQADGVNGYLALKSKIQSNQNALWATKELLRGEAEYKAKGGSIIRYLTTAWLWFENGASSWPDPYEVNCNDDRSGYYSEVSFFCNSSNFQIAGYQAASRKSNYIDVFRKLHSDSQLKSVMQTVIDNSYRASRSKWDYKNGGQNKGLVSKYLSGLTIPASITLNDISPNRDFFSEKGQFFTLIVGKDPKMAAGLNSYAVNSSFLSQLRTASDTNKLYGYIGSREIQLISNMMMVLYMIDNNV